MKQTTTQSTFRDAFHAIRPNNFSYEALGLLFDYFEDIDPDMELDAIAICCDYTEDTPKSIAENYGIDLEGVDEDDVQQTVREYLDHHTIVIGETPWGIVYANF